MNQPMSMRAFAWFYDCEAEFERDGPQSVFIYEPLRLPAVEGRCSLFGNRVAMYDWTGNQKVGEVRVHEGDHAFPLLLRLSDGVWYEVGHRRVMQREDGTWAIQWTGYRNTRTARWANGAPEERNRPEVVVFCGSSRFVREMAVLMWEWEKAGKIAMGLHLLPENYPGIQDDHQAEHEGVAAAMDELHLRKIDLADSVFVVNVGGYVGDSTRREIAYARSKGKPVAFLEPEAAVA